MNHDDAVLAIGQDWFLSMSPSPYLSRRAMDTMGVDIVVRIGKVNLFFY